MALRSTYAQMRTQCTCGRFIKSETDAPFLSQFISHAKQGQEETASYIVRPRSCTDARPSARLATASTMYTCTAAGSVSAMR